jgi:hypothetical protein
MLSKLAASAEKAGRRSGSCCQHSSIITYLTIIIIVLQIRTTMYDVAT